MEIERPPRAVIRPGMEKRGYPGFFCRNREGGVDGAGKTLLYPCLHICARVEKGWSVLRGRGGWDGGLRRGLDRNGEETLKITFSSLHQKQLHKHSLINTITQQQATKPF
jgi:hypothetical protein